MQVDRLLTPVPGTGPKSGVILHLAEAPEEGGQKGNFFSLALVFDTFRL
jgi:hypothetical protein